VELKAPFCALLRLARLHWAFAISEICKGFVVIVVGDLVVADELGALLGTAAQNLCSLGEFERILHALRGTIGLLLAGFEGRRAVPHPPAAGR